MQLDTRHNEVLGRLTGIEFDADSQTRATVSFETVPPEPEVPAEEEEADDVEELEEEAEEQDEFEPMKFSNYRTWRFGLQQILKFAGLRKKDLVDPEAEDGRPTRDDAEELVMEELEDERLVFKIQQEHDDDQYDGAVLSVVSPKYATVSSNELDERVQQIVAEAGITEEPNRKIQRTGFVVEIDYTWESDHEVEDVGDMVDGGISIRNSAFGASSLRVNKYYTVLACQNGMRVRQSEREFRQLHMGSSQELLEAFEEEVRSQLEDLWEETELIRTSAAIEFPLEDQIEWVEELAERGRITKRAAEAITEELEKGEDSDWNLGRDNAWNLVNAITGYATHNRDMTSNSSQKQLERAYNAVLQADDREELEAMVAEE